VTGRILDGPGEEGLQRKRQTKAQTTQAKAAAGMIPSNVGDLGANPAQSQPGSRTAVRLAARPGPYVAVLLLVAVSVARIAATYTTFTAVYDEPARVASGMQWLGQGTCTP